MISDVWILLALWVAAAGNGNVIDRVDLIELNHVHDECGKPTIEQIILWDWSEQYRRYDVVAWWFTENDLGRVPFRGLTGDYVARRFDPNLNKFREVRSRKYRETWTNHDPERANTRVLEEKHRSELQGAKR